MDAFNLAWNALSRRRLAMCSARARRTSSAIGTFSTRAIASSSAACSSVSRRVIDFGISVQWYHGIRALSTLVLEFEFDTGGLVLADRTRANDRHCSEICC